MQRYAHDVLYIFYKKINMLSFALVTRCPRVSNVTAGITPYMLATSEDCMTRTTQDS